jgi:hypothetical protein
MRVTPDAVHLTALSRACVALKTAQPAPGTMLLTSSGVMSVSLYLETPSMSVKRLTRRLCTVPGAATKRSVLPSTSAEEFPCEVLKAMILPQLCWASLTSCPQARTK